MSDKTERLQVVLARQGLASRRGVVALIESGNVKVNGVVVREKGFRVEPGKDVIEADGQPIASGRPRHRYFIFYKPKGVTTTMQDPHAEKTVADFFRDVPERLVPVGRLDRDTTGLLLMTNDGELAFGLTHPKFGVEKTYRVRVKGEVTDATARRLEKGAFLEEGSTAPCKIHILERADEATAFLITLREGKKRHIRRVFEKAGHFVRDLERVEFGPLNLNGLEKGRRRELSPEEIQKLKAVVQC